MSHPLYIHAGTAVDASLFDPRSGKLESRYWERIFDSTGKALDAAMSKHKDAYPRLADDGRGSFPTC